MIYLTGFHAINERIKFCNSEGKKCGPLLVAKTIPRARGLIDLAIDCKVRIDRVGSFELDKLAPDNRGIALLVDDGCDNNPDISIEKFILDLGNKKNVIVLIMDEITDPHNYGAIIRSCDQFGVDLALSRSRRNAKHAAVISKTSAGAVAWVPQAETANLVRALQSLKDAGFWIYGADMQGKPAFTLDMRGRVALVLGGEGTGISRLLRENCDALISIPSKGKIDSLNVSVAAGVLLYEIQRQQNS